MVPVQATDGSREFAGASLEAYKADCQAIDDRDTEIELPDVFCFMECNHQGLCYCMDCNHQHPYFFMECSHQGLYFAKLI